MFFKLKWVLSAIILSLFCKRIYFPSYFSFPIFFKGLNKVTIGRHVRIFPGSRFEVHGKGYIRIYDNVGIGQNFHITSAGPLTIGSGTVITGNVSITNINHRYQNTNLPILSQGIDVIETKIGENCFIGTNSFIQAGSIIGNHCIVGANSVVKGQFPDNCVIAGSPAKIIKKYNAHTGNWEKYE